MATAKQRVILQNLVTRSQQQYDEWITPQPGEDESPREKYIRENHPTEMQLAKVDSSMRYVFVPPSQEKTECLEARWIKAWSTAPEKCVPTKLGLEQIGYGA